MRRVERYPTRHRLVTSRMPPLNKVKAKVEKRKNAEQPSSSGTGKKFVEKRKIKSDLEMKNAKKAKKTLSPRKANGKNSVIKLAQTIYYIIDSSISILVDGNTIC